MRRHPLEAEEIYDDQDRKSLDCPVNIEPRADESAKSQPYTPRERQRIEHELRDRFFRLGVRLIVDDVDGAFSDLQEIAALQWPYFWSGLAGFAASRPLELYRVFPSHPGSILDFPLWLCTSSIPPTQAKRSIQEKATELDFAQSLLLAKRGNP